MDGDRATQARFEAVDTSSIYLPSIRRNLFIDAHEPNDTFEQAWGPLESGRTYHSYFPDVADEDDYFYLHTPARHSIEVWLSNLPPGNDYDLYLYNDATPHVRIGYSGEVGNVDEHIHVANLPAGKYYVGVLRIDGTSRNQPYHLRTVYK
jgi:hypothetical protein